MKNKILARIKKHKIIAVLLLLLFFVILYASVNFYKTKNEAVYIGDSTRRDEEKIAEAIKYAESQYPPRIGKYPTEKEIYESPYIKHLRTALNSYVNGTNNGVEEDAITATNNDMKCGLGNFSKDYYKSKFVILDALDNDYGGVQGYIAFIDKPDTGFWFWVYRLEGDGEYVLRAFCEKPPLEEDRVIFKAYIEDAISKSNYHL